MLPFVELEKYSTSKMGDIYHVDCCDFLRPWPSKSVHWDPIISVFRVTINSATHTKDKSGHDVVFSHIVLLETILVLYSVVCKSLTFQ